jgi:hypothetical protein
VQLRGFTDLKSLPSEFPEGKAHLWSWNINGTNATLTKGTLQDFISKNNPQVLCLNETKL